MFLLSHSHHHKDTNWRTLIKMCYKCSQSVSLIMEFVRGYFKCIYSFILFKKKIQYSLCLCNFMWSVQSVHIFTSVLLLEFLFFFIWFDITSAHTLTPAPPQLYRSGPSVQHFITVFFLLFFFACVRMHMHVNTLLMDFFHFACVETVTVRVRAIGRQHSSNWCWHSAIPNPFSTGGHEIPT